MAVFVLSGPPERAFRGFQADSFSCHQPSSHQEQVAGREQREDLGAVLGKTALRASMGNSYGDQLALEAQLQGQLRRTRDFREGVMAFMEKRVAGFEGR